MPFKSNKQRQWMHANKPEMAKEWEKKQNGGLIRGRSHEEGGELIEVEGNEVVVNDSVNKAASIHEEELLALNESPEDYEIVRTAEHGGKIERSATNRSTIDMLEYINEHGDLPMSDARKRRK